MNLPKRDRPIRLVGLTGSIATGKSTASGLLRGLGVAVVDADEAARRVVEPGQPAWEEIREAFGPGVFLPDGRLDREALGALVFADAGARARLNAIVHPRVAEEAERRIAAQRRADPGGFVVYDVPLLFEAGIADRMDLVVVVYADRATQLARLRARDGLSEADAEARVAAQLDVEEKARRADVALDNRGTKAELSAQVGELVKALRAHNAAFA